MLSVSKIEYAVMAQSAARVLGKDEVEKTKLAQECRNCNACGLK
jgi:hypothetical protein